MRDPEWQTQRERIATRVEVNGVAFRRKVFETASTILCWVSGQKRQWKKYEAVQFSVPAMHCVAFDY